MVLALRLNETDKMHLQVIRHYLEQSDVLQGQLTNSDLVRFALVTCVGDILSEQRALTQPQTEEKK